ncbi:hypothetical protein [Alsobacter sp. SYSU BS001988]
MTASDRRIAANRRNAQCSTGPRTEAGKQRSRFNARRHGLTGAHLTSDAGEEAAALEAELRREWPGIAAADAAELARLSVLESVARQARWPPPPPAPSADPGEDPTAARAWLAAALQAMRLQRYVTALSRRRAALIRRLLAAATAPEAAGRPAPPTPSLRPRPKGARSWPTKRRR